MNKQSLVTPSFLKQKSKQIKKEKFISWSQALDEGAQYFGFANYKNYLNVLALNSKQPNQLIEALLKRIYSEKDFTKKMELASSFIIDNLIPFTDLVYILKPFKNLEVFQTVCEKALLKNDIESTMLIDFCSEEGKSNIVELHKNYKAKRINLANLRYKMNEDLILIHGLFELTIDFDTEILEPKRKRIDHSLFGKFEMRIDYKDISMKYTYGHHFEGMCHPGSKTFFNTYSQ
jgi:hypothetical protein